MALGCTATDEITNIFQGRFCPLHRQQLVHIRSRLKFVKTRYRKTNSPQYLEQELQLRCDEERIRGLDFAHWLAQSHVGQRLLDTRSARPSTTIITTLRQATYAAPGLIYLI